MRYLTKSRFKLAEECPTKLFYTRKKEFPDKKGEDPFFAALAEGGFQVGNWQNVISREELISPLWIMRNP